MKVLVCSNLLLCLFFAGQADAQIKKVADSSLAFFSNPHAAIKPVFENLPVNAVKPKGWIKTMMEQDLSQGFTGYLDVLVPKIIKEDIYGTARRKSKSDIPAAGTQELTGAPWEISMQWWNGESQGNWWDGYMRNAFLTGNKPAMQKATSFVNHILASQDKDGYIGIYGENIRYQHEGDNGELWTQTTLFRMLLGYYEMTGDKKVLHAVEKAMALTMLKYNDGATSPFKANSDFGGLTHGLMITDVCETLNRITGNNQYNEFAVYLYKEFSRYPNDRFFNDLRYEYLQDTSGMFVGHSAHTYEHLRSLLLTMQTTGYPEIKNAYENALHKLHYCLLPGGGAVGDEWIGGRKANADSTGAEYCGYAELRNFYLSALQKTGDISYADKAEKLTFNDMQGARSVDGKGITYCKTDNCIRLDYTSPQSGFKEKNARFKYSPTHADAAVCCNPSYTRNLPYYLSNMWMKSKDGIAAVLYGPSVVTTSVNGVAVTIDQQTNYPLSDNIHCSITVSKPAVFNMYFRKPGWSKKVTAVCKGARVQEADGYIILNKTWKTGDVVMVSFENEIQPVETFNNEIALQRGALVYAVSIPYRQQLFKDYHNNGFKDLLVFPTVNNMPDYSITYDKNLASGFKFVSENNKGINWYNNHIYLTGTVFNNNDKKPEQIRLIPMGSTVLRKITFKIN